MMAMVSKFSNQQEKVENRTRVIPSNFEEYKKMALFTLATCITLYLTVCYRY